MDTEQYEEAVRDYEKIFKMDKSRGKCLIIDFFNLRSRYPGELYWFEQTGLIFIPDGLKDVSGSFQCCLILKNLLLLCLLFQSLFQKLLHGKYILHFTSLDTPILKK